ncbi:MAG TPA: aminodeoxychorismate synthase component I [Alphaproteobacteria bacterium]|nr:aminodeoxychorismate synthase component I [Alphaproteobacteria bacterium]
MVAAAPLVLAARGAASAHAAEIPFTDPIAAFVALRGDGLSVLLDSAAPGPDTGRYTIIGVDPIEWIRTGWSDAFERLRALTAGLPRTRAPAGWPFAPALMGSLGYELRRALEHVPSRHRDEVGPADLVFGLFDTVIVFDVIDRRAAVLAYDLDRRRPQPTFRCRDTAQRIVNSKPLIDLSYIPDCQWNSDRTPEAYEACVRRVLDYIRAGDIYQANFTQRWVARRPADIEPFDLYRRLRALSPAPYGAFIQDGAGNAILSASPERFLSLAADRRIDTKPIKGTRPRALDPAEDRANAESLRSSAKDRAENLMIVDLLRNDLGRVAEIGSVAVPELNSLHSFASVHHLVSTVTARLRRGLGPIDLLRACFPGGSVTGAPKIRAMEIIDELEAGRRGPYCGAIGWIGLDGAMELSIAIRTLTVTADRVVAQAGGGIVADSDPGAEYQEALTKARPLLGTLDSAFRAGAG